MNLAPAAGAGITQPFTEKCALLSTYLVYKGMRYVHRMRHSKKKERITDLDRPASIKREEYLAVLQFGNGLRGRVKKC